ncbi:MAG: DUF4386 domain-containing protein [Bacteroidales bacterium]|jgi:hypothetical protein
MKIIELNLSTKTLARTIGFFYLLIITGGLISGIFVRGTLIDPVNAEITLRNIIQNESLFRLGFLADLIMVLSDATVSVLFYFLLVNVNKVLAILAAVFRLLQSSVLGANLINLFKPILMIQGADKMSTEQLAELSIDVTTQMQVFEYGYLISGVFFAINCLLMGVLLYKSADFPKPIGIMIFTAGIGYLFNSVASFIIPSLIEISAMVMLFTAVIAELTFCAYLLIAGVRNKNKLIPTVV